MEVITHRSRMALALEMSTSEMAHARRERETTPVKQHQGKD
jgi:hypothetical protein